MRSLLLNLTSLIANNTRRAAAQIITLIRASAFWRSAYLIVILSIWFWLASKFWTLLYFWKRSGEAGTLIVILGVTGELIADLWYEERKRAHKTISGLSTLVLILGLVVEMYSNARVSALSDELIGELDSQVSHTLTALGSAMERASEANATAEFAKASLKGYDRQIAQANKAAAVARLEEMKLREMIQPRTLDAAQQTAISASLRKFARHRITVETYAMDLEGADLGRRIIDTLRMAGIDVNSGIATRLPIGDFVIGVRINGPDQSFVIDAARALCEIGKLSVTSNIPIPTAGSSAGYPGPPASGVILVGVKPTAALQNSK